MTDAELLLKEKFAGLLNWERTKRRERLLVSALFYSLLGSLLLLPARELVEPWFSPLSFAPILFLVFLILALAIHFARPWKNREAVRTVVLLDKTLHLEETAITAWEILGRQQKRAAEQLVVEEAAAQLRTADPRALFRRERSWHFFLAPPLLFLWLLLVWLDVGVYFGKGISGSPSIALAEKLKEFADELEKKARSQRLPESLKVAGALEDVADKGLKKEIGENELRERLGAVMQRTEGMGTESGADSGLPFPTSPEEELSRLRAEIEKLRGVPIGPQISDRLAALPRLDKEMERRLSQPETLSREETDKFLDRLEQAVVAELDRRTLQEVQEFLGVLIKGLEGKETGETVEAKGQEELDRSSKGEKTRGRGTLPGDELGKEGGGPQTSPLKAAAASHLKGLLGEGKSKSLRVKGELRGRESEIPQEEVVATYRRRAEQALASEEIPEGLKETIKRYFISIGMTEEKK